MTLPFYRYLDSGPEVVAFFAAARFEPVLALDLEADSLHHYPEKICLVQISTPTATVILDPLSAPEVLDGLESVLADAAVRKIVHGGDYDVRLLKRERGVAVRNLFDTMIAAQLIGCERFGLAALLEQNFGVVLDKRHQRADWSRRPLGSELLAYAAGDTAYLHALSGRLALELSALGRLPWAEEEFRSLEQVEPGAPKKPWCLDLKGAGRLAPRQLARLQFLLEMRDEFARAWDRPPFMVLGNQTLIDWAQSPPVSRLDLVQTTGASRAALDCVADRALAALERAAAIPEQECPRPEPSRRILLNPTEANRLARLRTVRAETARRLGLAPGLLVNGATLEKLAGAGAAGAGLLKNWQAIALGAPFQQALE